MCGGQLDEAFALGLGGHARTLHTEAVHAFLVHTVLLPIFCERGAVEDIVESGAAFPLKGLFDLGIAGQIRLLKFDQGLRDFGGKKKGKKEGEKEGRGNG